MDIVFIGLIILSLFLIYKTAKLLVVVNDVIETTKEVNRLNNEIIQASKEMLKKLNSF